MLDISLDYRHMIQPHNSVSHQTSCLECQDVVRHNHVAPWGIPRFHIVGTEDMHEVILTGGRGSHVTHATPSCTCKHGRTQRIRDEPANCYHVEIAWTLLATWLNDEPVYPPDSPYDFDDAPLLDVPTFSDGSPLLPLEMVPVRISKVTGKPVGELRDFYED